MNAFCTVVTSSYLHSVYALVKTLKNAGNHETLFVLVLDMPDHEKYQDVDFKIISLHDLDGSYPPLMVYYNDAFEACCAFKPFLVQYLFNVVGVNKAIYLDCDIFATSLFSSIWSELDDFSLILTPHHLTPPPLHLPYTSELETLKHGFINGGFSAWHNGSNTQKILQWMCESGSRIGFADTKKHMFCDQKFLPLALSYFPNQVRLSDNPGLNIAYWNAHERNVEFQDDCWVVNNNSKTNKVVFFHMSGYRLSSPKSPCAYLDNQGNAKLLDHAKWFETVIERYHDILSSDLPKQDTQEYCFDKYEGISLTPKLRQVIFRYGRVEKLSFTYFSVRLKQILKVIYKNIIKCLP